MLNYEDFKKVVELELMSFMPPEYKNNYVLKIDPVKKVNQTLDALHLLDKKKPGCISPTMYINDMYENYNISGDFHEVLKNTADRMLNAFELISSEKPSVDYSTMSENIVFCLVNTEQNKELLKTVPHREFLDLSVIYRWIIKIDDKGIQSAIITNKIVEINGLTEGQLFSYAVENTRRIFPPRVSNIFVEVLMAGGMPKKIAEMMANDIPDEKIMYVIGNEKGIQGAASVLYEDVLYDLANQLHEDLYILPSSIHEIIAAPVSMNSPEEFSAMVAEVNASCVLPQEWLSNQVYRYDKNLRKLNFATEV